MQGQRFYLEHMIRLGVPLNREWTGDVRDFCTVDGVIYPHLIQECVSKFKSSQLVEYRVTVVYDKLTAIESPTVFDRELADMQDELEGCIVELEHSSLKSSRRPKQSGFSHSRVQEICDKDHLSDGDYEFIKHNGWAFKWTFRGTPEQEEHALGVRFTCSDLGE